MVERTEHGLALSELLEIPFLYGNTRASARNECFKLFREGKLKALIVSKIGDEGLDLPNIDVLIMAAAGRAPHRTIQRIGRGRRSSPGKETLLAFDFEDTCTYLGDHYRRRKRTYEADPTFSLVEMTIDEILEE